MSLPLDRITALVEQLDQGSKKLDPDDDKSRITLVQAAWELARALERPQETLLRTCMLDAVTKAVVRVAFDLKLFQQLSPDEDKAMGSAELAEKTRSEQSLLVRFLNHLATIGFVGQSGPDRFYANDLTQALATEKTQGGFEIHGGMFEEVLRILPKYLAEHEYRDPKDGMDSPMQMAFNTKLHAFDYVKADPRLARGFKHAVLDQESIRRAHWGEPEFYPVQERLLSGLEQGENSVVMIDVGGGIGLDLLELHSHHPEPAGAKLILQDTEQVLGMAGELPSRVEKMEHDFFKEQPVKGARAYYFHRVFHDWTDEKCREILLALKPAMTPGYSKVLIQDNVIPAQGASWISTASDMIMMCGFAGRERSEENFRALFASVGMKVIGIWTRAPGEESVVEAIVPE